MERNAGVTNKVIILYILSRSKDLTLPQLTDLVIGTAMQDYFQFKQAFDALLNDGCIAQSIRKGESTTDVSGRPVARCDLTPRGVEVLRTLLPGIPQHVLDYLSAESPGWMQGIRDQLSSEALLQPDPGGGYRVILRLYDGIGEQMNVHIRLPNRQIAADLCDRFRKDPAGFHKRLLHLALDADESSF